VQPIVSPMRRCIQSDSADRSMQCAPTGRLVDAQGAFQELPRGGVLGPAPQVDVAPGPPQDADDCRCGQARGVGVVGGGERMGKQLGALREGCAKSDAALELRVRNRWLGMVTSLLPCSGGQLPRAVESRLPHAVPLPPAARPARPR
jgi:hypothetical protein